MKKAQEEGPVANATLSKDEILKLKKQHKWHYGSVIKKYRQLAGMNQTELARILGFCTTLCSSWERGNSRPDLDVVVSLCTTLHIPIEEFFGIPHSVSEMTDEDREILFMLKDVTPEEKQSFVLLLKSISEGNRLVSRLQGESDEKQNG